MLSTLRHQEIFNPRDHDTGITIVGAGAVGSRVFATLVELGLTRIKVFDPDRVEEHNLANQLFMHRDIGIPKTEGLFDWAVRKLGCSPTHVPKGMVFRPVAVTPESIHELDGTVFLLVDSLETRRQLVEALPTPCFDIPRVIDTRMAATHGVIYTFNPSDEEQRAQYLATLGADEDAEVSACGSPFSVAPTAALIANLAVWQFINAKTNPEGASAIIKAYFKPLIVTTAEWSR
ncbi:ThiF family adenylyltransferase [Allochromatium humboldtianum]|uniref:ThiF family adenylyltransferase n=1 Tax=Allochromatium humboldtianum TaxID=504901 RepID=A0A850R2Y4_9GAMM|nr:ThiF family adenylyltransferase [Allochromatium humboldtianum]NVZ07974.1 ThiF family adenylyltransferase [Allochromatium humboldtianum]